MSYNEDDARWDDYVAQTFVDDMLLKLKEENESRRYEAIGDLILDTNQEILPVIIGLSTEISSLELNKSSQSKALLTCTLIELIEKELIALPLLAIRFMFSDNHAESIKYLREIEKSKIAHEFVVLKFFKETSDEDKILNVLDQLYSRYHPADKLSLVDHRKILSKYRNWLAHADKYLTAKEAEFVIELANKWRDLVFNTVLGEFGLKLTESWEVRYVSKSDLN